MVKSDFLLPDMLGIAGNKGCGASELHRGAPCCSTPAGNKAGDVSNAVCRRRHNKEVQLDNEAVLGIMGDRLRGLAEVHVWISSLLSRRQGRRLGIPTVVHAEDKARRTLLPCGGHSAVVGSEMTRWCMAHCSRGEEDKARQAARGWRTGRRSDRRSHGEDHEEQQGARG